MNRVRHSPPMSGGALLASHSTTASLTAPTSNSEVLQQLLKRSGMGLVPRRPHSPPFKGGVAAPSNKCREASLAAQTGWLVKRPAQRLLFGLHQIPLKFKPLEEKVFGSERSAPSGEHKRRLRNLLLTTPSAPIRNGVFLLRRSHPSFKG